MWDIYNLLVTKGFLYTLSKREDIFLVSDGYTSVMVDRDPSFPDSLWVKIWVAKDQSTLISEFPIYLDVVSPESGYERIISIIDRRVEDDR